jgi:hypothetical protein
MSVERPAERTTTIEEEVSPQQKDDGTTYVCIPKRVLRKAGYDPDSGDVPDELSSYYTNGGARDGILEFDLKEDHEQV